MKKADQKKSLFETEPSATTARRTLARRLHLVYSLENRNKVLTVTRTDANGNFEFKDFVRIDSTFTEAHKGRISGGGEFVTYGILSALLMAVQKSLPINAPFSLYTAFCNMGSKPK